MPFMAGALETQISATQGPHSVRTGYKRTFIALILLVWAVIYFTTIFSPPLMDDADTVHAEAAREMVLSHDWVTLHINNGFRYLEKAPLMYWLVAASFKIFGVHEWSARLPIALGVLALLLMVYRLGRRVYGEEGGLYSALVMATGFGPFIFTRILIPDMLVGLWLAVGFDLFLASLDHERPSRWLCWGIAATMALNVLTKGLIGLVFPVAIIVAFLLLTGNLRHLLKLRPVSSFAVFLIIAAPWHLLAGFRNPAAGEARGFFWFYFVNEHFLRYLNKRFPADYDTVPLWLFWGLMLLWLMPWTAFSAQALAPLRKIMRKLRANLSIEERGTLLFAIWMLAILVFFSFSSRQEYYVIPAVPGFALLVGGWLARETNSAIDSPQRHTGRISSLALLVLGVVGCVASLLLALEAQSPPTQFDIAELLKRNPEEYKLSFGHFLDLTPQAMGAFKTPLLVTGIALLTGVALNWLLRRSNRTFAANLALTAMMVVFLHEAHAALITFSPVLSSRALAQAIESHWQPGAVIEDNGDYENASSLNFYTHRQLRFLNGRRNNIWYGSTFPDAPPVFDDDQSFLQLWRSGTTVFFFTHEEEMPAYMTAEKSCVLGKWGGKLLLTNELRLCPAPDRPR